MQIKIFLLSLLLCCLGCTNAKEEKSKTVDSEIVESEIEFDKEKWSIKEGKDYPYRDKMVNNLVDNDTVRTLGKPELLELLGPPDRTDSSYLFYTIAQKRIKFFPLHTKTMVIKLSNDSTISWIKIHE